MSEAGAEVEVSRASSSPTSGVRRWGYLVRALVAGLVVSVALGLTLLTWALSLLAMLGLFFFMLFGLLIGACMFRFGAGGRPFSRGAVVAITLVVALAGWGCAMYKEALDFPRDFVGAAIKKVYIPRGKGEYDKTIKELDQFIAEHLREHYPPGGVVGYLRMAAAGDSILVDMPNQPKRFTMRARVPAWQWWTRGALALVLLFWTTHSVVVGLTKAEDRPRRARTEKADGSESVPPEGENSAGD